MDPRRKAPGRGEEAHSGVTSSIDVFFEDWLIGRLGGGSSGAFRIRNALVGFPEDGSRLRLGVVASRLQLLRREICSLFDSFLVRWLSHCDQPRLRARSIMEMLGNRSERILSIRTSA